MFGPYTKSTRAAARAFEKAAGTAPCSPGLALTPRSGDKTGVKKLELYDIRVSRPACARLALRVVVHHGRYKIKARLADCIEI